MRVENQKHGVGPQGLLVMYIERKCRNAREGGGYANKSGNARCLLHRPM